MGAGFHSGFNKFKIFLVQSNSLCYCSFMIFRNKFSIQLNVPTPNPDMTLVSMKYYFVEYLNASYRENCIDLIFSNKKYPSDAFMAKIIMDIRFGKLSWWTLNVGPLMAVFWKQDIWPATDFKFLFSIQNFQTENFGSFSSFHTTHLESENNSWKCVCLSLWVI